MFISTTHRNVELLHICRNNILYMPNHMIFSLDVYPKTYSLSNTIEELWFLMVRRFPQNDNICPVHAIQCYMGRTALLTNSSKVFIMTQTPFGPVSRMTIRRWVLKGLHQAGINVAKYSSSMTHHS